MTSPLLTSLVCVASGLLLGSGGSATLILAAPAPTAIQSFTLKGHEDFPGPTRAPAHATFEVWCQLPDRFVIRAEPIYQVPSGREAGRPIVGLTTELGFNGDEVIFAGVWPGGTQTEMGTLPPIPPQAALQPLLPTARWDFATLGALLFSGDAGLLVPVAIRDEILLWSRGAVPAVGLWNLPRTIRGDPSDYRDVDGVRAPFRVTWQLHTLGGTRDDLWTFDEIHWNVAINPRIFRPTGVARR